MVTPPIARGQTWLCQPLPVSTVPNTGWNLSNSNYRGLVEEDEGGFIDVNLQKTFLITDGVFAEVALVTPIS